MCNNKRCVLRRQCWNTNWNIKRFVYCQYVPSLETLDLTFPHIPHIPAYRAAAHQPFLYFDYGSFIYFFIFFFLVLLECLFCVLHKNLEHWKKHLFYFVFRQCRDKSIMKFNNLWKNNNLWNILRNIWKKFDNNLEHTVYVLHI